MIHLRSGHATRQRVNQLEMLLPLRAAQMTGEVLRRRASTRAPTKALHLNAYDEASWHTPRFSALALGALECNLVSNDKSTPDAVPTNYQRGACEFRSSGADFVAPL
jgi:hypothetical protein